MNSTILRNIIVCATLVVISFAAHAADREVLFNGVEISEHNLQVIESNYDLDFENGRYWYDRSSGLWGSENGGPEGRIAAGLHIGGAAPEAMSATGVAPASDVTDALEGEDEVSADDVARIIGGVLELVLMGEMMEQAEQAYYDEQAYYEGGAYQTDPNGYYDGQGNYDYDSGNGSGSQYSDGSWIHSSDVAGGSVGGTSDGCIYTSVAGGWSNC